MIDRRRLLRAAVLIAWSGFFTWLWSSGEMTRYLGPRTYWVVVFGAVSLGAAGLAHLLTLRGSRPRPLRRSDGLGATVLILPLVAALAVPDAQLGAQAASRKRSAGGFAAASLLPVPEADGEISFIDIHYAGESADYAASAGVVAGVEVDLTGFVTPALHGGRFSLTRFYVSCCAADAIPYSADITTDDVPDHPEDTWLRVRGHLVEANGHLMVEASEVEVVETPRDPYLY